MSSAELQQETVAAFPQRQATETTELSTRNAHTETFPWRRFDDKKPELLTIRPYVIKRVDYLRIQREKKRLEAIQDEISEIESDIGALRGKVWKEQRRNPPSERPETDNERDLRETLERIEELKKNPLPTEYYINEFYLKVIVDWPFTNGGVPIPLTVEGLLSIDPDFLNWLDEDLTSFLYGEDRKKRRKNKSKN